MAHPELAGDYVQPFTLDERLRHARQAEKQLGASIPWLVDAMDNRLKRALGGRPNSEFVIDPQGVIVRKRAWSHPGQVRKDLEELVGPVERVTPEDEVRLKIEPPLKTKAARGVAPRILREDFFAIRIRPQVDPDGPEFYAKLRAEADMGLLEKGAGRLYLGFHLDPLHDAHWNNLTKPLQFEIEAPETVKIDRRKAEAPKVEATSDADPREFVLQVEQWPDDTPLRLTVTYFACVGEEACHAVRQQYVVMRQRDEDGGRVRSKAAGNWDPEEFTKQMLQRDKNGDGLLNRTEVQGLVLPHFERLDADGDGQLNAEELKTVSDWLNNHHRPSPGRR